MTERWLDITDVQAQGREFVFDDQELWAEGAGEFDMEFTTQTPLSATFTVTPQTDGALVRGRLTGMLSVPCDRCTTPTEVKIDQRFDLFEQVPKHGEEVLEPSLVRRRGHRLELDVNGLLWEEFVLALPVKPLCSENCKGLCPECGQDLNAGGCGCSEKQLDPRMAALRGLTIVKKDHS